ncbi:hypothetical protein J2S43_001143 [Catenuloplanes nepalensis]|uniref:Uncharacterized protein n=1 Tax=Catenuloplanes nepalensis TaxID=587533 RepID=A0ABT9MMS6_9ACTN|nr:hypothetical protein [Catenuloplanes nepalensis]MDP9792631.1 hypothetical protein [Catenuloplanes nepalensis]
MGYDYSQGAGASPRRGEALAAGRRCDHRGTLASVPAVYRAGLATVTFEQSRVSDFGIHSRERGTGIVRSALAERLAPPQKLPSWVPPAVVAGVGVGGLALSVVASVAASVTGEEVGGVGLLVLISVVMIIGGAGMAGFLWRVERRAGRLVKRARGLWQTSWFCSVCGVVVLVDGRVIRNGPVAPALLKAASRSMR